MIVAEHIQSTTRFSREDKGSDCLDEMSRLQCFDLPVFDGEEIVGRIHMDDCKASPDAQLGELLEPGFPVIGMHAHTFDAIRAMQESDCTALVVLDSDQRYGGLLSIAEVVDSLAEAITIEQQGAVILVECANGHYSSSEIARIIEGENAQLLGLWLEHVPESGRIRASLKVNTSNAERIVNSLLRFNYEVVATFGDLDYQEHVEKRYLSLMKYLDT